MGWRRGHVLGWSAFVAVMAAGGLAQAEPCSALTMDCEPTPCRTADQLCPEGQVCAQALDDPPCANGECPQNGHCVTLRAQTCHQHADCDPRDICYHDGKPLCEARDPDDGPPCSAPTSIPQGTCGPATECAEDSHCDQGFVCVRHRLQLGFSRTVLGACVPHEYVCLEDSECPEGWRCQEDPEAGTCLPPGHVLSCSEADGCQIMREAPAMALSAPHAAPAPMRPAPPAAPAPQPVEAVDDGGCAVPASRAHHGEGLLLVLLGAALALRARNRKTI